MSNGDGICSSCKHSLENNAHGFDQNDAHMEGDKLIHSGRCTYCKECNPGLKEATNTVGEEVITTRVRSRQMACGMWLTLRENVMHLLNGIELTRAQGEELLSFIRSRMRR